MKSKVFFTFSLIFCIVLTINSCKQETAQVSAIEPSNFASVAKPKSFEIPFEDISEKGNTFKSNVAVEYSEITNTKIKYSNIAAIQYAKTYAPQEKNACGVFLNDPSKKLSDCAHFVAHCLHAGGITIKNSDPNLKLCPMELSLRVVEIKAALRDLDAKYENVKEINIDEAITGDYGFFNVAHVGRPSHAFMVCKPAQDKKDYLVYAHTAARNCTKTEPTWYQFFDVAFRMEDGP